VHERCGSFFFLHDNVSSCNDTLVDAFNDSIGVLDGPGIGANHRVSQGGVQFPWRHHFDPLRCDRNAIQQYCGYNLSGAAWQVRNISCSLHCFLSLSPFVGLFSCFLWKAPSPLACVRSVPAMVLKSSTGTALSTADASALAVATDGNVLTRGDGTVFTSQKGTKESIPCSGRGYCELADGTCHCYTGFRSSNGKGAIGDRGDCGFDDEPITSCPGVMIECSGHGRCSGHPEYQCACEHGWTGGDCSLMTCKQGIAWFDEPSANNIAHSLSECSNAGRCNRKSGVCECHLGFEGEACERMSCPGKTLPIGVCSGHGRCLSPAVRAKLAQTNGVLTPFTYGLD